MLVVIIVSVSDVCGTFLPVSDVGGTFLSVGDVCGAIPVSE